MKAIRITKALRTATLKILFGAVATIALVNYLAPARAQINRASIPPIPSPSPTPSPASQIKAKYASTGGPTGFLGAATSAISRTADGVGYFQDYQYGSIYWTPATGAHETHGEIWRKYKTLGGPGALGYPATDELSAPCGGRYSDFKKESVITSVYWKAGIGAFETHGLIKAKYLERGGPCTLGYPTTDETATEADPAGRYNHFSNGYSIYWKPATGAHEVRGAIRDKYLALGGPDGFLGFPCTGETVTGVWALGRYNNFEGGSIYWMAQTGAHEVHGAIRERWEALGGVVSWLGYPLTDESQVSGFSGDGRYNKFQGGAIYYYPDSGVAEVMDLAGVVCDSLKLKPSLGTRKVLAILWDPLRPDHPAPPAATIDNLLFGPDPSVRDWYEENSGGRFRIERAGVLGWYIRDKSAEHYWNENETTDKDGDGWLRGHAEKLAEAIRKADSIGNFNFAAYDTNGDKELSVDELSILVVIPQNSAFGSRQDMVGREAPSKQPLTVDGVRISRVVEMYAGSPANLGIAAHELSHLMMDTPDIYQEDNQGNPLWWPFASRTFSIMDATYSTTHFDPVIKLKSGWLNYTVALGNGEYRLRDVETSAEVLIVFSPNRVADLRRGPAEYFIIENRFRGVGFSAPSYDAGRGGVGEGLPNDGIAIWHVIEDPKLLELSKPPVADNWGRRGIRLVRADGGVPGQSCRQVGGIPICMYLPADDSKALLSNPGDFISGAAARRNGQSSPARLRWIDGSSAGFRVELISAPAGYVRVGITIDR